MSHILNLVKENDTYQIIKFPDGQQSIKIDTKFTTDINKSADIIIFSRLNTFLDLEIIICANQALREMEFKNIKLFIPYCIGGRSDRKFQKGGINYIKTVISPIINSQNFSEVVVMDPHSDVLEACINNFTKISNSELVRFALRDIDNKDGAENRIILVSPDGGALKKIYDIAEEFQIPKIITATKHRDIKTGNITHTEIPKINDNFSMEPNQKFVIVDDICDGGRTFIELAKTIRLQTNNAEIYLIVTHGIFSNGLVELNKYFSKIYTTNSFRDITNDNLKQFDIFLK